MDGEREILEGMVEGERGRERPRATWTDIKAWTGKGRYWWEWWRVNEAGEDKMDRQHQGVDRERDLCRSDENGIVQTRVVTHDSRPSECRWRHMTMMMCRQLNFQTKMEN